MKHYVARTAEVGGCMFCAGRPELILVIESDGGFQLRIDNSCYKQMMAVVGEVALETARRKVMREEANRPVGRPRRGSSGR